MHVAATAGGTLADWGAPVGAVEAAGAGETTIGLTGASGSFVLVFFTALPPETNPACPGGNPFAVTVAELAVGQD